MRYYRVLMVCSLLLVVTLASGGPGNRAVAQDAKPELYVYNWSTYFAEDTLSNFESQFNVKVVLDTYASNEELLAKLQAGNPGFDVIFPSNYVVEQLIKGGLLETLDKAAIPNFEANVSDEFESPPFDPNREYCVTYQWGTTGIGYNSKRVTTEIKGWKDVFENPALKGRVAVYNVARDTIALGLFVLGKDPNTKDRADLEAATDYIRQYKDVIAAFHDDDGQTRLISGNVDVVAEYSGDIFQAMEEDADIVYVIPEEGSNLWTDEACIPTGGRNKELALKFLNYLYDPKVAADISNFTKYATPNQKAIDDKLILEEDLANTAIYPTAEVRQRLKFFEDVGDLQLDYDELFADLKAAIGQ